jgi:hypothetical protein
MTVKTLFVFRWQFKGQTLKMAPILIVADDIEEAERLVSQEDNQIANESNNFHGYTCVQQIRLYRSQNLSLILK